jgi:hypothetical protein
MNTYTDIKVLECNRLHSEESRANNDENYAHWTNNLQDIFHLEAGDQVSVYGAMVSERGAGQSSSIEIKGESLGITSTYQYINLSGSVINASEARRISGGYDLLTAEPTTETKELFDNKGNFLTSYFIPANGHNYIELPRRFWYSEYGAANYNKDNYYTQDSQGKGMSFADPFGMTDSGPGQGGVDRWDLYDDYYQISCTDNASLSKVKNDNSRFTIMIREKTPYSVSAAVQANMPDQFVRDPENGNYYVYRELKEIVAPRGFNSPEFLSTEVTRQLQKVTDENTFLFRGNQDITENPYTPGFPIPVTKSISTETFKPFRVAGYVQQPGPLVGGKTSQEIQMDNLINTTGTAGAFYLSQYHVFGCKRPEIYETGRLINRNPTSPYAQNNCLGSRLRSSTTGEHFDFDLPYQETYVNLFRDFIRAQEKYPEVWNIFSDSRTLYDDGDNINNSRWCHINRFSNASMTFYTGSDTDIINNTAMLGWGGYKYQTWNASKYTAKSLLLPFKYDASQRDIYYHSPIEKDGQRTYGCFGKSPQGKIRIYGTEYNGTGSDLLSLLIGGGSFIESERKIGFDQHFSAPGMVYVLPCDMRPNTNSIINASTHFLDNFNLNGNASGNLGDYDDGDKITPHKLYFGANAPKLNWNGTNFTISDLHTGMNKGNNQLATNVFAATAPYNYSRDLPGEADVVYKINPREDFCDFSPVRKPYLGQVTLTDFTHGDEWPTSYFNGNLEPWRVYDSLTGIMIEDFGVPELSWSRSLWGLLGFSYKQFNSTSNTRLSVINYDNANDLSVITTNSEINEGDSKIYTRNAFGVPLFYNRLPYGGTILNKNNDYTVRFYPEIIQATQSIQIVADNLPTRMIRGYYTIRSNILQDTPFIGGKVNNTTMPIVGVVNKINGDGDFYFQQESSLVFTITKPLSLASITCSIHDPDGSFANVSEQSTVLFKVQRNRNVTFNVLEEILQEQQGQTNPKKQRL